MKKNSFKALKLLILAFLSVACENDRKKIPDIDTLSLTGNKIDAKYLENKTIVFKIWATWCGSCVSEIPELNALVAKYKSDTNIVFIAITDDNKQKIESFLTKKPFDYQHITDAKKLKGKFYDGFIQEIPKHIVLNTKGEILYQSSGEIAAIASILDNAIQKSETDK